MSSMHAVLWILDVKYMLGGGHTDLGTPCFSSIYYLPPQRVYPFCVSQK